MNQLSKKSMSLLALLAVIALPSLVPSTAFAESQPRPNQFWWPDKLDLTALRQHGAESNPRGEKFDYAKEFSSLDLQAVKKDIAVLLKTPQAWWPSDYGTYGPFFIRMAWHSAGTYRSFDGRGGAGGGQQRFEPLNSWPDNANLDKARRLVWPVKQKYGRKISWSDLIVLTGNVALESMGFKTFGFGGGREDDWEPELVYWGSETKFLASDVRYSGNRKLEKPLAAVQMGLIYVNPEGPNGNPDPLAAAKDIRETFGRMAMNDEETVALVAGGHTFGKAHGAHKPAQCLGPVPAGGTVDQQGFGWVNSCGTGNGDDTVTSGLEGAWSSSPTAWSPLYLENLFKFDWVKTHSPAGAVQWMPARGEGANLVPDAQDASKHHPPMMFTTDLSMKVDPSYRKIAQRFKDHPEQFQLAFSKAWFKLTHRDMGPRSRYLGSEVPKEELLWQDPVPPVEKSQLGEAEISTLKSRLLASGLSGPELVRTAWASASSFRGTDMRGGANGARIRLAPQKGWAVNNPAEVAKVLQRLESIQNAFNKGRTGGARVSLADLIVLGGSAAVEQAAQKGGFDVKVPFTPGRTDATQAQTDVSTFAYLEPAADGFRNYYGKGLTRSPAELLVDKASLLTLTVPEMTVLVGGMRALNANAAGAAPGVLTNRPGTLSNDFFANLLDMSVQWTKSGKTDGIYEGKDRKTGNLKWTATPVDLLFGSNSELRAVAEVYAEEDAKEKFVRDFIDAWTKVMNLDRFDIPCARSRSCSKA